MKVAPIPHRSKLPEEATAQFLAALQNELVGVKAQMAAKVASLEETIANLANENTLLKRRLFGNKTERSHTSEAQLALGSLLADVAQLQKELDGALAKAKEGREIRRSRPGPPKSRASQKGGATCSRATCRAAWWRSSTRSWRPRDAGGSVLRRARS